MGLVSGGEGQAAGSGLGEGQQLHLVLNLALDLTPLMVTDRECGARPGDQSEVHLADDVRVLGGGGQERTGPQEHIPTAPASLLLCWRESEVLEQREHRPANATTAAGACCHDLGTPQLADGTRLTLGTPTGP